MCYFTEVKNTNIYFFTSFSAETTVGVFKEWGGSLKEMAYNWDL